MPRVNSEAARKVRDLERDGLYPNEIAQMIEVTEVTIDNWKKRGTQPQAAPKARLDALHAKRCGNG